MSNEQGTMATDLAALDPLDRRLLVLVAEHRARTGAGPTWRELRAAVGLPAVVSRRDPDELRERLIGLRRAKLLKYSPQERSLDIGKALRGAFAAAQRRPSVSHGPSHRPAPATSGPENVSGHVSGHRERAACNAADGDG